jgi:hypothetical protein
MHLIQCVGCGMKIRVIDAERGRGARNASVGQVLEIPRDYEPPRLALWRRIAEWLQRLRR